MTIRICQRCGRFVRRERTKLENQKPALCSGCLQVMAERHFSPAWVDDLLTAARPGG